jgi:putative transposase
MKKRFTEAQIVGFLREVDAGIPVKELCRKHGFSEASYYLCWSKFGGMNVFDAKRLKELEIENSRLARSPVTRPKLNRWRLSVVRVRRNGVPERYVAHLDSRGRCAACGRDIIEAGITAERTVLIGHRAAPMM